ncbi:MAG: type II toxin-antitoxin system HicA family toxin [Bacteroidota bacterium]
MKVLEKACFSFSHQSRSHKIYKNQQGKRTTVPYHSGVILHPKMLKSILKDADITVEKFKRLMSIPSLALAPTFVVSKV